MRAFLQGVFVVGFTVLAAFPVAAEARVRLDLVSVAPTRAHFVRPGTETTFVVRVRNTSFRGRSYSLSIELQSGSTDGWSGSLSLADEFFRPLGGGSPTLTLSLPPRKTVHVLARIAASTNLAEADEGRFEVRGSEEGRSPESVTVAARVRNQPKVYYVAIDAAGRDYLRVGRDGNWYDGSNERLMPRSTQFLSDAAFLSRASGHLPATTDGNHTAALSGSWPGTLGIFSVKNHYLGVDADNNPVIARASKPLLRWGVDGRPVQTIFDVIKNPAQGGSPETFNALITGKAWVADIFAESAGVVDLLASGLSHPSYVPPPEPYRVGDPVSDPDPATDREGTNLGAFPVKKLRSWQATAAGLNPKRTPEDRWIAEAAMRVIAAEDPDALYVVLAECDTVQHIFGSADAPDEWEDNDTPGILWDDENVYNRKANRDPVLDIVHEADASFGLLVDFLKARDVFEGSYLVLLSDHGQTTVMHTKSTVLDVGKILTREGVGENDVERLVSAGQFAWIALADPARGPAIEALLESHEEFHPTLGRVVKPFVVLDRAEMESGIDDVEGSFTEDGIIGNLRGELYSAWSIDVPASDNSKVRWPDLMLFTRYHFQTSLVQAGAVTKPDAGTIFNGHHAAPSTTNVILGIRGPGVRPGTYEDGTSLADIAPTLYRLLGVALPENVDGKVIESILNLP